VGYNPAYGAFVGASIAIGGWLGDPKTTSISAGSISGSYAFSGQVSFQFKSDFYTSNNGWALKGDWRYLDTSQPTFGLGPVNPTHTEYPMDFVLYRLYQTGKVMEHHLYAGFGIHYTSTTRSTTSAPRPASPPVHRVQRRRAVEEASVAALSVLDTREIMRVPGFFWNAAPPYLRPGRTRRARRCGATSNLRGVSAPQPQRALGVELSLVHVRQGAYLDRGRVGYLRTKRPRLRPGSHPGTIRLSRVGIQNATHQDRLLGAVGFLNFTTTTTPDENIASIRIWDSARACASSSPREPGPTLLWTRPAQDDQTRFFLALRKRSKVLIVLCP
jgi:hypothetical protein